MSRKIATAPSVAVGAALSGGVVLEVLMRFARVALIALAFGSFTASSAGIAERIVEHTIATGLAGAYQVLVADLNNDKKPDLIVLSTTADELVWFENPSWRRHVIASGLSSMVNLDAGELDGDGIPELALAHGFSANLSDKFPGNISILTHQGDPTRPWSIREIDRVPKAHRIRFVDVAGNGKKGIVVLPIAGPAGVAPDFRDRVPILYYRPGDWKRALVTDAEEGQVHGVLVTHWDGNRRDAFLDCSYLGITLNRFVNGNWSRSTIVKGDPSPWPKSGASDVVVGHLGRDRFIAAIEPFHGNQIVVYTSSNGTWQRKVIDDTLANTHTIVTVDLDGDGRDEIVAGTRSGAKQVLLYTNRSGNQWTRESLDNSASSPATCAAADLNMDGRPDLTCIGDAGTLKWYENQISPPTR
jgi:aldos-2-ulose dehydratase/isomerase family protein/VCBS repeat protein